MFSSGSGAMVYGGAPVGATPDVLVVFAVVLVALVLFTTELLPVDVTAILVMVLLIVLEPWTGVSPSEGLSGFASPATVTVLAMFVLSAGVSQTGVVHVLGQKMADFAGDDLSKQLAAIIGVSGPASGFVNNTPVVAMMVPVVSDIADRGHTSPSKLLIPLSYASMLGGMLTLVGTSTNILASDVSARLLDHRFSMFEFTQLGVVVLAVGSLYLLLVGHRLLPERVLPDEGYAQDYALEEYMAEVVVREDSPLAGKTVREAIDAEAYDADILQIVRSDETAVEPFGGRLIRAGDVLRLRTDQSTLERLMDAVGLEPCDPARIDGGFASDRANQTLVQVVVPSGSYLVGESLASSRFRQRYDANVLAFRSRGELVRERMDHVGIRVGDTLLVQAPEDSIDHLAHNPDFIVARPLDDPKYRTSKMPHALGIVAGVVGLAALDVLPIVVAALGGIVAMVAAEVVRPAELYDAVEWNVIFLLAGVIPLGIAMERSGAAELMGATVASTADFLPVLVVLWLFYVGTGLVTEVISNNASVVLMIPVGIETAQGIGANPFAFVLAVTFAASTAFLGPIGYQTNLIVFGPGGYRFTDYVRVGVPLQLLLSTVTVAGIALFWGLRP